MCFKMDKRFILLFLLFLLVASWIIYINYGLDYRVGEEDNCFEQTINGEEKTVCKIASVKTQTSEVVET